MNDPLWAVYTTASGSKTEGINLVCEQSEWDAMVSAKPGQYTLIRGGIASEGEAERLARGTSGDPVKRRS